MEPSLLSIVYFVVGAAFGSFVHAWVCRKFAGTSVFSGRSRCIFTGRTLTWYENIPIVSFLIQRGKSRYADKHLSWTYFVSEVAFAVGFAIIAVHHEYRLSLEMVRDLVIFCYLGFIFFYDLKFREIHDAWSTYPAIVYLFMAMLFGWGEASNMLVAMVIGSGFFLLQYVISKGKWIGGGDVRLGLFMGVVLGFPRIFLALMLAYVVGALWSLLLIILQKKKFAEETPFGTYLSLATFVAMIWGEKIIDWYMEFLI